MFPLHSLNCAPKYRGLRLLAVAAVMARLVGVGASAAPVPLLDDRAVTIRSAADVATRRAALVRFLWGADGFPSTRLPEIVVTNIASPVKQLSSLARVDEFRMPLAPGLEGLAWHFMPVKPNGGLVVVHHGHACTLDDDPGPSETGYGLQRTIHGLLKEGYGVLGVFMPHMRPGDCTGGHESMFKLQTTGSPMKFFVEPVVFSLNYLRIAHRRGGFPAYRDFHMVGLSGGGWTTTVYAAIDPTIQCSFPVAGSIPLYLRTGGSVGDLEQFEPKFYGLAGYPDLYVLGAAGPGRRQVQVLVQRDDCCFGAAQHDEQRAGQGYPGAMQDYAARVSAAVMSVGAGSFRLAIDEVAPSHMISHHTIDQIVLPTLREARGRRP